MSKNSTPNNIKDDGLLFYKLKKLKFQSLIYVALFIIFSTISDFIIEQSILPLENYIINIICGLIVGSIFYLTSKHHIKKD